MNDLSYTPRDLAAAVALGVGDGLRRLKESVGQAEARNATASEALAGVRRMPVYPDARVARFHPPAGGPVTLPAETDVELIHGNWLRLATAAPVTIDGVAVRDAEYLSYHGGIPDQVDGLPVRAVLRLVVAPPGDGSPPPDAVSLWFGGATGDVAHALFEALTFRAAGAFARTGRRKWVRVAAGAGGFGADELLYPVADELRFLCEAVLLPEKFFFLRLSGLGAAWRRAAGEPIEVAIAVTCGRGQVRVRAADFLPGCVPVVNAGPGRMSPVEFSVATRDQQLTDPDGASPDLLDVTGVAELIPGTNEYGALRRPGRGPVAGGRSDAWYVVAPEARAGWGYDTIVSRTNPALVADSPASVLARVEVLRTDGPRAALIPANTPVLVRASVALDGELLTGPVGPVAPASLGRVPDPLSGLSDADRCESLRAFIRSAGLADGRLPPGCPASPARLRSGGLWADAVRGLTTVREATRLSLRPGDLPGLVNGRSVVIDLDPEAFPGRAPGLFVAALDRCLGLATPLCRFTRLVVRTPQEEYRCTPRLGSRADL